MEEQQEQQKKIESNVKVTRKSKNDKTAEKANNPLADFIKEVVGKLATFCGTTGSGIDTIEGVPMAVLQDPNGRWFIKFYSSDESRAYLYLDQVSAFYTHSEVQQPIHQPGGNVFDMNEVDSTKLQGQQSGPYCLPLTNEYLPDEVQSRRGGLRAVAPEIKHIRKE